MNQLQQWEPVAVIVAGYLLGFYFQNSHLNDFIDSINKRFDDMRDLVKSEVRRLDERLARLDQRLDRLETHPIVRP